MAVAWVTFNEFDGAMDDGFEIGQIGRRDFFRIRVLPLVLITHAAAGKDGHLQFGAAKAKVFHRAQDRGRSRAWQDARKI